MSRPASLIWLLSGSAAFLASLLFSTTLDAGIISSPVHTALSQAIFVSLTCYLLLPGPESFGSTLINSSFGSLLFIVINQMPFLYGLPLNALLKMGGVVFCFGAMLWSLAQLFESGFTDRNRLRSIVIMTCAVIVTAPIWFGPVAEIYPLNDGIVNGLVSINPLTHLAVAAEYDYLRSEWFYRVSVFGSLPFNYPGMGSIAAFYLLFVSVIQIIMWRITDSSRYRKNQ